MSPMSFVLLALIAAALFAYAVFSHVQLSRSAHVSRRLRRLDHYPSVTVIRPIKGLDVDSDNNARAALDMGYPGEVETLFVFDTPDEPALPIVKRAIGDAVGAGGEPHARVLFCGPPPAGRTGKLNAMIAGFAAARGELIAFADSDIQPSPTALTRLVESLLSRPDAGAAFAPVVVTQPTRTIGDAGYALMLNGLYAPVAAHVAERRDWTLPFIMGQFMLFRRDVIEAIGGLEAGDGQLVDDMYLGSLVERAGYRNVMSPEAVPIIQHDLSFNAFAHVYLRWLTFSRTGLPGLRFKRYSWMRGSAFYLGVVGAIASLALGMLPAALLFTLAAVGLVASVDALHVRVGGHPLPLAQWWAPAALMLAGPLVLLIMHTQKSIEWRGRRYPLTTSGRLDEHTRAKQVGRRGVAY